MPHGLGFFCRCISAACVVNVRALQSPFLQPVSCPHTAFHWAVASTSTTCYLCANNFYLIFSPKSQIASWVAPPRCPLGISNLVCPKLNSSSLPVLLLTTYYSWVPCRGEWHRSTSPQSQKCGLRLLFPFMSVSDLSIFLHGY